MTCRTRRSTVEIDTHLPLRILDRDPLHARHTEHLKTPSGDRPIRPYFSNRERSRGSVTGSPRPRRFTAGIKLRSSRLILEIGVLWAGRRNRVRWSNDAVELLFLLSLIFFFFALPFLLRTLYSIPMSGLFDPVGLFCSPSLLKIEVCQKDEVYMYYILRCPLKTKWSYLSINKA